MPEPELPSNPAQDARQPAAPNVGLASMIMTGFLLLSRVLGLVRNTVMASKFGLGGSTDAYRLAFAVPDTIFYLIAGGALSSAFIPVFSELLHTDREDDAWELFNVVVTVMSLIVVVLIGVAWVFAPQLIAGFAAGKDPALFPLIVRMSRIVLPAQFAFFIGGLMFGALYAKQRFALPGLGPNIYNLGIIFGALVISAFVTPGIVGMSWGATVGAFVGNLLIPMYAVHKLGARFRPSLNLKADGVKRVFQLMLPVILGLSLPAVYGLIMQKFASTYSLGINTSIDLSNQLMQAPLGIFGQSLALAAFPALTQFYAQKRMDLFRGQLAGSLRTVLYLSLPASFLLAAGAPQIVTLLYAYGKTSVNDLPPTWNCLRFFCIGIFAWCLHPVLMRSFYAMHRTVKPIVIGTSTTIAFVLLYFLLRGKMGYLAMPLSGSIAAIGLVIVLGWSAYKDVEGYDVRSVLLTFARSTFASAVMGGAALLIFRFAPHHLPHLPARLTQFLVFAVVSLGSAWIYYFITRAFGMSETEYVNRGLARAKKRFVR